MVQVPADYRDPEAGSIRIAVNVHRAASPDQRIGYLLVNPGGPGASGLNVAFAAALGAFPDEILESFDIVGFDPRGVGLSDELVTKFDKAGLGDLRALVDGGSEPEFACGSLGEQLALLAGIDMPIDTPEEIAAGEAAANLCIQSMGPVGGRLHSEYVANDMDEIRQALGVEQISYLGFSYGSELGVWYATLFPDSVRAMAVDGARNPFPSDPDQLERVPEPEELVRADTTTLAVQEARLAAALAACADPECPIYNGGDPVGYFKQGAAKVSLVNAAAGNHPHAGYYGVYRTVRSEDDWPMLWQGLFELYENDDAAILLNYAREESYITEIGASFNDHVTCLDQWVVAPENDRAARLEQEAKAFANESRGEEKYPLLWSIPAPTLPDVCTFYDQFAPEPVAGPFDGGGLPILVVGNHDDLATSFSDSEEVATQVLSNGYLVETSHYKHVTYPQNQCVNNHIHRALIDGELPSARRVVCEEDRTFAPGPKAGPEPAAAGERIDWNPCGPLECGSIQVPADYRDPDAGSINIAVNVHRATSPDERIGYLFVNPGGPGWSGLDLVQAIRDEAFTYEVVAHFDIVGFDPRGVGASEPAFACGDPGEQLTLLSTIDGDSDTPEEIAASEAAANLCIQSMGPVGALLHTEYVARDMDEIRQALGAGQISYYGSGYGATLGAQYAALFPQLVRAMVVDSAGNPVNSAATQQERIVEQIEVASALAAGLEAALTACADPEECPIYNDGDPVGYFMQAAAKLHLVNAAADNPQAGVLGVISTLYDELVWPALWKGLYELNENDDPSLLVTASRLQLGGDPTAASFTAHVNCLDNWALYPELDRVTRLDDDIAALAAVGETLPLLAVMDLSFPSPCPFYDQFAPEPPEGPLDGGGAPILVIGNRDDPVTSFDETQEFAANTLRNGYLLETSHHKHVVYPENQCVNRHVHRALIDGVYPGVRKVFCHREDPEAPEVEQTSGGLISLVPCAELFQCGGVEVPADYRDPEAGNIKIWFIVHPATSPEERIGYLFMNPGGPGQPGAPLAIYAGFGVFPDEIVERFDIVGFDPRGVGDSDPDFACGEPGEQLALLAAVDGYVDTPEDIAAAEAAANLCIQSMGPVGGRLHSAYVANDMDEIRKGLGADQISYLGYSYGSALGAWYATLFPQSVRAMVVDGASNPVGSDTTEQEPTDDVIDEETLEFEAKLAEVLAACADPECPIYNDGDPVGYYYQAAAKLDLVVAAADNTPSAAILSVIGALYDEADWPVLWQGLFELNENDDPSILFTLAEKNLGPEPSAASFTGHVNCLDEWVLHPENDRAARLAEDMVPDDTATGDKINPFPLLTAARRVTSNATVCDFYDQFAPPPLERPLDGSGVPILVVGNHNDPITSFRESEELATEVLSNGYLVETSHPKHTVYPKNQCVNDHVHRWLIDNVHPSERRVFCERED